MHLKALNAFFQGAQVQKGVCPFCGGFPTSTGLSSVHQHQGRLSSHPYLSFSPVLSSFRYTISLWRSPSGWPVPPECPPRCWLQFLLFSSFNFMFLNCPPGHNKVMHAGSGPQGGLLQGGPLCSAPHQDLSTGDPSKMEQVHWTVPSICPPRRMSYFCGDFSPPPCGQESPSYWFGGVV